MSRYILDTHVLLWFLQKKNNLPKYISEDIGYYQDRYCISSLTLIEIDNLKKLGKIDFKDSHYEIIKQLQLFSIDILYGCLHDLEALSKLEMKIIDGKPHGDYMDRMIIATAIANNCICISADSKFPFYENDGLQLLKI